MYLSFDFLKTIFLSIHSARLTRFAYELFPIEFEGRKFANSYQVQIVEIWIFIE